MNKAYNLFKVFKEIYPLFVLLLVLMPIFTGLFIDSELFNIRDLIINILWIPLLTVPAILLKQQFVYKIVCTFLFVVGFIEISHWVILQGPVTITSFLVISNTNLQESIGFFDLKATYGLLILIPYIVLYIFSLRIKPQYISSQAKPYILGFTLLVSGIFIFENAIHGRLIRKGSPQIIKVAVSFIQKINLYKEAMQENKPREVKAYSLNEESKEIFVLIIGESCNRNHMSLYGYSRKTNPKLEKRNDLLVFNDVVSPYSNTLNSVLAMLSQSNLIKEDELNSIDIIDIFHSAGFKTYWISNQSPIGIWDNMITVFSNKSDYSKFVNTTSNSSYEAIYTTSFDSKLFRPFESVLREDDEKKFIILHLMGSHATYSKRYPPNFNVFKGSDKKTDIIAEYDNSILYNDLIVDSLLKILEVYDSKQDLKSSAIYLSDHGENVYDELDRVGHDYSNTMPKANVEIPFVVWLSSTYINLEPEKTEVAIFNRSMPFISDDLFHAIMDIAGIQSPYFEEEKSIFSKKFNDKRVRVLEDGNNYDK